MKNIYIGNLEAGVTESELRSLFQAYGTVDNVSLVKDRDTGHSRGFAFVEMRNNAEADAAVNALNGMVLGQQPIRINEARSKHEGLNGKRTVEQRTHPREALTTRSHRKHRY